MVLSVQGIQCRMVLVVNFFDFLKYFLYPSQTVFVGGYTVFTSDHPTDRPCDCNVLFP